MIEGRESLRFVSTEMASSMNRNIGRTGMRAIGRVIVSLLENMAQKGSRLVRTGDVEEERLNMFGVCTPDVEQGDMWHR